MDLLLGKNLSIKLKVLTVSISLLLVACGGGGSGTSENVNSLEDKPVVDAGEGLTKVNEFRVLDVGAELTAQDFSLETWNPSAMALDGDILYISNSQTSSQILRYDLKQKRALSAIDPTLLTGLAKTWDGIVDISLHAGRLYVASYGSNRIDVIDIATGQPQFVMALGTGVWWGDALNYALVHSNAVTADDRFVYVPDIQGRINVWQQSDVRAENHLKANKFARLSLPNCARNCNARMQSMGDYLYTSLPNGTTYVHNLKSLKQGDTDVAPILTESTLSTVMNQAADGQVYVSRNNGVIESYLAKSFNTKQILPTNLVDQFSNYRVKGNDSTQNLAKASDLVVHESTLLHLANQKITLLPMRSLQQNRSNQTAQATELKQAQAIQQSRMLQDGESWEVLTNKDERHVFMDKILSAQLNGASLDIQSYSAVPVKDVQLHAKLKNSDQWVVLAHIDEIQAFSKTRLALKLDDQSRFPLVNGQGSIQLSGLSQTEQIPAGLFDFKFHSDTDLHVQKLNQIKAKWKIFFGTYNQENDPASSWRRINALYAREWVMMMTNLAYMLSTPEFEHLWFNHNKVMGHEFFGNAGLVEGENGIFKAEDYTRVYQQILNRSEINLGITAMGGGLGGGSVLGVDTWIFYGHYRHSGYGIIAHEFGHGFGNHSSAWSNSAYGFQPMMAWLHFYFQRQAGSIPYMDPDVNKFHLASPDQLYAGVTSNIVNAVPGKTPINTIDQYFAANPLAKK